MEKLEDKGIQYSAVLNGNKSAVTVEKKNTEAAYMSRANLKREAQRISNKGKENKGNTVYPMRYRTVIQSDGFVIS